VLALKRDRAKIQVRVRFASVNGDSLADLVRVECCL